MQLTAGVRLPASGTLHGEARPSVVQLSIVTNESNNQTSREIQVIYVANTINIGQFT